MAESGWQKIIGHGRESLTIDRTAVGKDKNKLISKLSQERDANTLEDAGSIRLHREASSGATECAIPTRRVWHEGLWRHDEGLDLLGLLRRSQEDHVPAEIFRLDERWNQ